MKMLLIMPDFFDYPQIISEELENMGYEVDVFNDRPSNNAIVKAILRINKDLITFYVKKYFDEIMKKIENKSYEIVLLISGQSLSFSASMLEKIKNSQPHAKFILYQWDSEFNFPYIKKVQYLFDKCYSFDKTDAEKNSNIEFLPLFYSDFYKNIGKKNNCNFKYDFCFVGTAHPKKYKYVKMMSEQLKNIYPNQYIYFYFPSRIVYIYRKVMNVEFRDAKYSEFHFTSIEGEKMNDIYENTRCVFDSPQSGQNGLTIRVLEALGAKKKVITTNADIKNYDFYCPENIYVYDGKFDLEDVFFKENFKEIDDSIYEKYSLKHWLRRMICNE